MWRSIAGRARWGLFVFLAAFAVRLAAIWALGPSQLEFGDSRDYLETSQVVCAQGDYPESRDRMYFRPPGFPLFISLVTACHTERIWLIKLSSAAIDSLTVLLIWAMAAMVTESARGRWLAVAIAAVNPIFLYQTTDLRSEPLCMFLLTGALAALFAARARRATLFLLLAGVLLGLAALTRPAALVAIPVFSIAWVVGAPARRRREALTCALVLAVSAAAVIGPWTLFVSAKHHELILVNDTGGFNLWRGTHPELIQAQSSPDRATYSALTRQFELVTAPSEARAVASEADSPMGRSRAWRRRAVARMERDPGAFLKALAGNLLRYWRPWLNPMEYGPVTVLSSAAMLCSIYLLGALGIASVRTSNPWLFWFVLCWLVVIALAHAPFQTVMRYRLPFTDPLLIAFVGRGVHVLRSRFSARGQHPLSQKPVRRSSATISYGPAATQPPQVACR